MTNPLLPDAPPPPPPPEEAEHSAILGDQVTALYGPAAPLDNDPTPSGRGLPRAPVTTDPLLWVIGLTGGSGAGTLAALLDSEGRGDVARLSQVLPLVGPGRARPRVLFVARTDVKGLGAAAAAAAEWATGTMPIDLLGLAVCEDAPKLPPALVGEVKRVGGMVPRLWHLPWVEAWRTSLDIDVAALPRRTRKSLLAIREVADHAATTATPPPAAAPPTRDRSAAS